MADDFYAAQKLEYLTLSAELNQGALSAIKDGAAGKEIIAQGALPLMISEYCALGSLMGERDVGKLCNKPCGKHGAYALRDEKGFLFPCRSDAYCRMHIFNSRELCLLEEIPQINKCGIVRLCLDLRLYDEAKAARLTELYRLAISDQWGYEEAKTKLPQTMQEYTKGHFNRGV
jgi:putative protease